MIQHVILGSNRLAAAAEFFDRLLSEFSAQRVMENERMVYWMSRDGGPGLAICTPFDGAEATVGNGVTVALRAASREQVDRLYHLAIELGGRCEGEPGPRGEHAYGAYFRDLDGNKFNLMCIV